MKSYYVYILTNKSRTLYAGMTNDLERRIFEHKTKAIKGFTAKYNIDQLVWFESTNDVHEAIAFEKKIKGWKREKKIALIEKNNPDWLDLSRNWLVSEKAEILSAAADKLPRDDINWHIECQAANGVTDQS